MSISHNGGSGQDCIVILETVDENKLQAARSIISCGIEAMIGAVVPVACEYNIITNYTRDTGPCTIWAAIHAQPFKPTVSTVAWSGLVVQSETPASSTAVIYAEALAGALEKNMPDWVGNVGVSTITPGLMSNIWKQMISDTDASTKFMDPRLGFMDFVMRSNDPLCMWSDGPERSLEFGWPLYP